MPIPPMPPGAPASSSNSNSTVAAPSGSNPAVGRPAATNPVATREPPGSHHCDDLHDTNNNADANQLVTRTPFPGPPRPRISVMVAAPRRIDGLPVPRKC